MGWRLSSDGKVERPVLPVTGLFGELSAGADATVESIIRTLATIDENLAVRSNIPDSITLVQLEALELDARRLGFKHLEELYHLIIVAFRANQLSKGGYLLGILEKVLSARMLL